MVFLFFFLGLMKFPRRLCFGLNSVSAFFGITWCILSYPIFWTCYDGPMLHAPAPKSDRRTQNKSCNSPNMLFLLMCRLHSDLFLIISFIYHLSVTARPSQRRCDADKATERSNDFFIRLDLSVYLFHSALAYPILL